MVAQVKISEGTKPSIYGGAADESWGYKFGVDGLLDAAKAGEFLCISGRQLDRLANAQKIRKGMFPSGHRAFCKRSIENFAASLET